jgi:hypothetical protein
MQTHTPLCFVHFAVFNVVYSIYICFDILSFVVVTLSIFSDAYVIKGRRGRDRMIVGFTLLATIFQLYIVVAVSFICG